MVSGLGWVTRAPKIRRKNTPPVQVAAGPRGREEHGEYDLARSQVLQVAALPTEAGQLDDAVVGAPGMPVARSDREAESSVERRCCLQIMDCVNDVIETARHESVC